MNKRILYLFVFCASLLPTKGSAQLSSNPDKFLGNITTGYQVDAGGGIPAYYKLWNQITCENESKWGSVEGNRGSYNWSCDNAFNYAKQHSFTYKFHALVWGSQYPSWLEGISVKDRYASVVKWFDAVKKKYATLPMIDVVNEAVGNHQPGNPMVKEMLGGGGKTGYDWLIRAFDMAGERWPDAILIYNDYNSLRWDVDNYITLVQTLRDAGAPIDAYGNQSHDVNDISKTELSNVLKRQQDALQMPMFITELDIDKEDDEQQKAQFQTVLPLMWEAPYCAGVTLWGYVLGRTWVDNSGLYRGSAERPAMTWIKEYMTSNAAKNAKSPFPGAKKEASIYIRPASLKVAKGDVLPIKVRASLATKTIEKVDLYVDNQLVTSMTEAPYVTEYTPSKTGWLGTKAVVTATDGSTYTRYGRINVTGTTKREPYNGTAPQLPGVIMTAEYDRGTSGVAYSNASRSTTTTVKDGAWMDYTVDVKEDGVYTFDAEVAASKSGGLFHLAEYGLDKLEFLSEFVEVPKTGGTSKFVNVHGQVQVPLTAGRHTFTLLIDKGGFCIKSLSFSRYEEDKSISVTIASIKPSSISVGDSTVITVTPRPSAASSSPIANVKFFANSLLIGTLTEAPYSLVYYPEEKGSYTITAVATDSLGKSKTSVTKTLTVKGKRMPYKSVIAIPGIVQAENFDQGGEGLSFHDSDSNDEGDAKFRTDNEGLDLVKGNSGTAIGYTAKSEWTEYSVNVTEPGEYSFNATCSNGASANGGFSISLVKGASVTKIATVTVTPTGGWGTYKVMTGKLTRKLTEGEQILRFVITDGNCNIDKVEFVCTLNTGIETVKTDVPAVRSAATFNLSGQKVGSNYRGLVIRNGRKILRR